MMDDPSLPSSLPSFFIFISYRQITYDDPESLIALNNKLLEIESGSLTSHRMIYLATPAEAYHPIMRMATSVCRPKQGWFRAMVEKPFGRDLLSCIEIQNVLKEHIELDELFFVDHYLGKPMISCIISAKRSSKYSSLFNNKYIKSVHIKLKEDIGTFGRSYFENYGIIRDMIQSHGLQLLSLIAMRLTHGNKKLLSDDKLRLLKSIRTLNINDCIIGQYTNSIDGKYCSYRQEIGIPLDSLCITYCTCLLYIDNDDWKDVPFIITSGKALDERLCEVRLNMNDGYNNIDFLDFKPTSLVFRIHPTPSVFWIIDDSEINVGEVKSNIYSDMDSDGITLNNEICILRDVEYAATKRTIEGAYENLFYHAFSGRKDYFPTIDEVKESWRILSPVINQIENEKIIPIMYPRGSTGPQEANEILKLL